MPSHWVVCRKCHQHGGTLKNIGDAYEHIKCPEPKPKGQRVVIPGANVAIATPEDVWKYRQKK